MILGFKRKKERKDISDCNNENKDKKIMRTISKVWSLIFEQREQLMALFGFYLP